MTKAPSFSGCIAQFFDDLHRIADCLCEIKSLLANMQGATGLGITQLGGSMGTINGIVQGGSGTFAVSTVPAGSSLQSGNIPNWSASDPTVALTPSADGKSVVANVASFTGTTFTLTVNATSANGNPLTASAAVPILPPVVPATGLDINQTA